MTRAWRDISALARDLESKRSVLVDHVLACPDCWGGEPGRVVLCDQASVMRRDVDHAKSTLEGAGGHAS